MIDKKKLDYFKTIGRIQTAINKCETLDEAFQEGLRIIVESSSAEIGVIWIYDEGDGKLHPQYWICPLDLTSKEYEVGKGVVGEVYSKNESKVILSYKKKDKISDSVFEGLSISSMVCTPFDMGKKVAGCIQFLKTDGKKFVDEEADICEIMTMLVTMVIDDNDKLKLDYKKKDLILSARNIIKEFQNGQEITRVLKGVNLDVYKGEFLAILGESGCGKSTMLNIIGGLDEATDGTFSFMGKEMSNCTQAELTEYRRKNIGFIFQNYNLMKSLTAKQNLDIIAELVDNPLDSDEVLKLVKLQDKKNNYPSQLSGGQQQRVSIARALIKNPVLIFADEPTAALDYETSIEVLSVLEEVVSSGTTLIMVTHNEEITRMADRVIRFRDGKVYEIKINRKRAKATDLVW